MTKPNLIALRLDPEMRERLESAARAEDRSISSMVRRIIAAWLAQKEKAMVDTSEPPCIGFDPDTDPCPYCGAQTSDECMWAEKEALDHAR